MQCELAASVKTLEAKNYPEKADAANAESKRLHKRATRLMRLAVGA